MILAPIDFHSHILPGIDDGSRSVEETLAMLRMEAEQGVRHIVATPHFYARHDYPDEFLNKREESYRLLQEHLDGRGDLPGITLGAEVHYFPRMSESDVLQSLTLGKSQFILVEMPMKKWTDNMYRELEDIRVKQGLTPVVAHIDRYLRPFQTARTFHRLSSLPVLIQANAEFFTNRKTARKAMHLLSHQNLHLIGSDCHDPQNRKPNLGGAFSAIGQRLGDEWLNWIYGYQHMVLKEEMKP